jgi:toxin YoeB
MLRLTWTENALKELDWWQQNDIKLLRKIIQICLEICKDPIKGIGKPEPLKFDLQGYWSRRINQEHRIIYTFDENQVTIIQCRFHYHK